MHRGHKFIHFILTTILQVRLQRREKLSPVHQWTGTAAKWGVEIKGVMSVHER